MGFTSSDWNYNTSGSDLLTLFSGGSMIHRVTHCMQSPAEPSDWITAKRKIIPPQKKVTLWAEALLWFHQLPRSAHFFGVLMKKMQGATEILILRYKYLFSWCWTTIPVRSGHVQIEKPGVSASACMRGQASAAGWQARLGWAARRNTPSRLAQLRSCSGGAGGRRSPGPGGDERAVGATGLVRNAGVWTCRFASERAACDSEFRWLLRVIALP